MHATNAMPIHPTTMLASHANLASMYGSGYAMTVLWANFKTRVINMNASIVAMEHTRKLTVVQCANNVKTAHTAFLTLKKK
jgi:hypothetical protein